MMRNLILPLMLVVCGLTGLAAQERQVGAKVGPTFGRLMFDPADNEDGYRTRAGGGGGGFAVLPLTDLLSVQFEGLYLQKGGKFQDDEFVETATILLDYLEFPVLLRVGPSRRAAGGFHLFAGPAVAIRVGAKRQFSFSGTGGTVGEAIDIRNEIERFESSLVVGGGIDLHRHVVLDGRYSWGLTAANRDRTDGFTVKTRLLAIMLGVRF